MLVVVVRTAMLHLESLTSCLEVSLCHTVVPVLWAALLCWTEALMMP